MPSETRRCHRHNRIIMIHDTNTTPTWTPMRTRTTRSRARRIRHEHSKFDLTPTDPRLHAPLSLLLLLLLPSRLCRWRLRRTGGRCLDCRSNLIDSCIVVTAVGCLAVCGALCAIDPWSRYSDTLVY